MNALNLTVLPLAIPLFVTSADEIKFEPTEGLVLTKTFQSSSDRERTTASERGSLSSTSESSHTLVVTDSVKKVADGRVLELERVFDEIGAETESSFDTGNGTQDVSSTASSELDAETVTFEWDEDEEEYVASSDGVDDELLEELRYNLDFTALLPDGDVAEDDEWEIDPGVFEGIMSPWGQLSLEWESSNDNSGQVRWDDSEAEAPQIEETEDGEVTARYVGTRDEDGTEVAVIELTGEVESERVLDQSQSFESGSSTVHQETTETREVEGEVLWNIAGGHLHSIELELSVSGNESMESTFSFGDREFNSSSDTEISGTSTFSVLFEAGE